MRRIPPESAFLRLGMKNGGRYYATQLDLINTTQPFRQEAKRNNIRGLHRSIILFASRVGSVRLYGRCDRFLRRSVWRNCLYQVGLALPMVTFHLSADEVNVFRLEKGLKMLCQRVVIDYEFCI